ncbi:hypothetical protein B6N60_01538 [Richelia sinica FACHB-800]|uniref:PEP-CTERM protein-sorting domain-containing protein n=2 Tax=Richelia TaxID=98443 RepID=A0A975T654_9NOST|nr:hypothetical protein B6N60_01538 [Richelia sinica FACHB-800]
MAIGVTLTGILTNCPAQAVSLITQREDVQADDQVDWGSLDFGISIPIAPATTAKLLPYSFTSNTEKGFAYSVNIPNPQNSRYTPPFIFSVNPFVPVNFSLGDAVLFTGFIPSNFPAVGNPGPITINFDSPVFAVGTQIGVDDSFQYDAFISAFDSQNNLLGSFSLPGIPPLNGIDNSALFLGIRSETANIAKITISSTEPNRALGINFLSIRRTLIPEPSTILAVSILGLGMIGSKTRKIGNC